MHAPNWYKLSQALADSQLPLELKKRDVPHPCPSFETPISLTAHFSCYDAIMPSITTKPQDRYTRL